MKWLTLDYIKMHSRIDYSCEDSLLTIYGEAAEDVVLNAINRSYNGVLRVYGAIPKPLYQAALMLVDLSYQQRSPISSQHMSSVPYTFDVLTLPYAKQTYDRDFDSITYVPIGTDAKIAFTFELPDDLTLSDIDFSVTVYNDDAANSSLDFTKAQCIAIDDDNYLVIVDTDTLGVGTYMLRATLQIPDTDFDGGIRQEVVNINPYVRVTG